MTNNTNNTNNDKKKTNPEEELYYCEKELRALGKSLECCVCIRLMESPSRTRWYYSFCVSSFWKFPLPILIHSSSHSAHYFCKKCILDCAKANGKCPLCKSDVSRREVKPDAMMAEMIELYKKLVVKVVKEEEEDKEEEEEELCIFFWIARVCRSVFGKTRREKEKRFRRRTSSSSYYY